jgi:hypothetical protein
MRVLLFVALTATTCSEALTLQRYLERQGATRSCDIGETIHGRGLVATRDLEANEVALRIPISCALVEQDLGGDNHFGRLALQLMERYKDDCPYAKALPPPPETPARGDSWPDSILNALDDPSFEIEISETRHWRHEKWEKHSGSLSDRSTFLEALDLVCSRTVRSGNELMLVPLFDMANHASEAEGGGYHVRDGNDICLVVGERGARCGSEVTLNYGDRRDEDWLLHYGFLPERNTAGSIVLPGSQQRVSWDDLERADPSLRQECSKYLKQSNTSLTEDFESLQHQSLDYRMRFALDYRISRKMLLSAVAGDKAASPRTSAFSSFAFSEV